MQCVVLTFFSVAWSVGWSMQCFAGWGYFAKLAFLGLLMVCFEWWAFEITVVMAGNICSFHELQLVKYFLINMIY